MYQGDSNLKSAGEKFSYSSEQIQEIIKAKEDIIYFAEKYFKIVTIDEGEVFIKLYDFQKKIIKGFLEPPDKKRHCVLLSGRQIGKCVCDKSLINIRVTKNGKTKIRKISIGRFYLEQKILKYFKKISILFGIKI